MQPSHDSCTLYSNIAQIWCDFSTCADLLTQPVCTLQEKMVGKDDICKMEYSPVAKISKSEALWVRQCSAHLGEYGLTFWVVSILMYAQELHHTDT